VINLENSGTTVAYSFFREEIFQEVLQKLAKVLSSLEMHDFLTF
jgi:hypothetical protein